MKLFVVSVFVLLLAAPCLAQSDDVVRVKSNLVNIDVLIKDKKGKYVPDLKAEDFTIYENGVQQKIEDVPHKPRFIHTVHGDGYSLTVEART